MSMLPTVFLTIFSLNNLSNRSPRTSPATPLLFLLVKFYEITSW